MNVTKYISCLDLYECKQMGDVERYLNFVYNLWQDLNIVFELI